MSIETLITVCIWVFTINIFATVLHIVSVLKSIAIIQLIKQDMTWNWLENTKLKTQIHIDQMGPHWVLFGIIYLISDWVACPHHFAALFTDLHKLKNKKVQVSIARDYTEPSKIAGYEYPDTTRNIYKLGKFYTCGCQKAVLKSRLVKRAKFMATYSEPRAEAYLIQLEAFNKIDRT
jgi:hypothetical protein